MTETQAGGQVGKHITEHLLSTKKHTITAITRPDSTSGLPEGVKIVRVNYGSEAEDDVAALIEALRGQQALVITMSHAALPATRLLIRAAAAANVPYVLPNWFGHDAANTQLIEDSLMTSLYDNVREVERLGVSSYFLLVCNFWYEVSLSGGPYKYGFDLKKKALTLFDGGNVKINASTWPQCGRAIAKLLSLKEVPDDEHDESPTLSQLRDQCVYVSSFRVSQRDVFDSVKRVTGTTDAEWEIHNEETKKRYEEGLQMAKKGYAEGWMKMGYSRMFFPDGAGDYETTRGLHNERLGLTSEDLDQYTAIAVRMSERSEI